MVEEYDLSANTRGEQKAKHLRNDKKIPAVIYGNDYESRSIAVNALTFNKVFEEAGESALINLKIDDEPKLKVLVHDIQIDAVTGGIIHVDFYKVNMKEKIKTAIPIVEIGESSAVVDLEGALITNKDEVEVECLPADLIPEIEVDISVLKTFEDVIKVSDLKVSAGIEILDDPEEVVFLIQPPRSEEEMAELEEEVKEDVEAVEVEGAKPAEGEEGAEGESSTEEKPTAESKE
ncbi:MAG: 50S ribosomal protein L25 [Patescibacteria group bacterium]|jgi:large subunit ribosomal protein L25